MYIAQQSPASFKQLATLKMRFPSDSQPLLHLSFADRLFDVDDGLIPSDPNGEMLVVWIGTPLCAARMVQQALDGGFKAYMSLLPVPFSLTDSQMAAGACITMSLRQMPAGPSWLVSQAPTRMHNGP